MSQRCMICEVTRWIGQCPHLYAPPVDEPFTPEKLMPMCACGKYLDDHPDNEELRELVAIKDRQLAECTKVMREVATEIEEAGKTADRYFLADVKSKQLYVWADRLMAARAGK